jgi:uncharacterized protein YfiM (DUF2279 family)
MEHFTTFFVTTAAAGSGVPAAHSNRLDRKRACGFMEKKILGDL